MPRPIFKNRVIAAAGPLPGQLTVDNLQRWTEMRKGSFSAELSDDVTHLLCTREQFDQRVPWIKAALARKVHIIHHDWFEFSTAQDKRQPESDFSLRKILAEQRAAKREEERLDRGRREAERGVNPTLFHIYHDRDFFAYQVVLTRDDPETGEPGQKYTLCLWESNAKPHLYWFTARFTKKKAGASSYHRPSPCSGLWKGEMRHFTDFFRIKTGIEWQDRVLRRGTTSPLMFQYSPPTGGKPVGRRLRFCYDYCVEVNARLRGRGLPEQPSIDAVEPSHGEGSIREAGQRPPEQHP